MWHAITHRHDLVIANSHPPVLMGCALRLIRAVTGTRYIYHCQDLHPEAAALVGDVGHGRLFRLLRRLDTATCRGAERVVVLSHDMANSLAARGVAREKVAIINNPPLTVDSVMPSALPSLSADGDVTRFLFAGNLGRFQGLERLVEAAVRVATEAPWQIIFMGDGVLKPRLIEIAGELAGRQIAFVPHQSVDTAFATMRECAYGIVSLQPNVYRYAYPSKTAMYLSTGCPVMAIVEAQSELACTIRRHELGYVSESHSLDDIAASIAQAICDRHRWTRRRRQQVARAGAKIFGDQSMLSEWCRLFQCLHGVDEDGRALLGEGSNHAFPISDERIWSASRTA